MELVAKHLEEEARRRTDPAQVDLFARTSFNRYYYACFLIARSFYTQVIPGKRVPTHKDFPVKIEDVLYKMFVNSAKDAQNAKLINSSEAYKTRHRVRGFTGELASLLREGYAVRCVADYEPEQLIHHKEGHLYLGNTSLSTAVRWVERVRRLCGTLRKEWRDLGN